jgi:phosphate transport system substrate-binding protein
MGFTPLDYPRVDGSTSTHPLGVIVACKMLDCPYRWAGVGRYAGRWFSADEGIDYHDLHLFTPMPATARAMPPGHQTTSFSLVSYRPVATSGQPETRAGSRLSTIINRMLTAHAGTHGAYVNVIEGQSDLALVARRPSADELARAEEKGVALDLDPIALDAFVFLVHHRNPVTNLSAKQIRDIYGGRLKSWQEVGGPDERIRAYQRNPNSGSQELMESLVMKGAAMMKPESGRTRSLVHNSMGGPYIALTHDQQGMAYSVYYYEHYMAASPNTRTLAVDGVQPSYETILNRSYPYVAEVYVVTRKGLDSNAGAARMRAWLLTDEGQAVVRESGYVQASTPGSGA